MNRYTVKSFKILLQDLITCLAYAVNGLKDRSSTFRNKLKNLILIFCISIVTNGCTSLKDLDNNRKIAVGMTKTEVANIALYSVSPEDDPWLNNCQYQHFQNESCEIIAGKKATRFLNFCGVPKQSGCYGYITGSEKLEGIYKSFSQARESIENRSTSKELKATSKRNNSVSSANDLSKLEQERQAIVEERLRLGNDERRREQAKQSNRISIISSSTQPDSSGVVTINIQTNTDTSSLKINGEELGGKADGSYSVKRVARVGQDTKFTIVGVDVNGNIDSKTISVIRQPADSKAVFGQLNAVNVKQQPARDAVAIIIGIEKYKRVAKADFANADAQVFYDYANRALGIKPENIKLLVDDGADDAEIYRAFQNWLPLKVKKGKTEVFVFFSGHGLPSQDGKSLYLLPWGVDKDFVEKTAINQQEIIASLQAVQPKSVTMFIDSCYSGQARGGETLLASARPIALKAEANAYPPNFTVISASAPDQLSSSSPDLKHGIFSYYLMKGMEGDADQNKDGKITVAEIQEYLTDMVGRQAMGMNRKQQPQLFGDADRVLVGR